MLHVHLRPCGLADIPAVAAIYGTEVEEGTASFELAAPAVVEMTARRDFLAAGGYPYLVAEVDGVVAGYAYAGAYRARPAYRATVENSVYVDRRHRGRGVAARLLSALVDECAARDFRQMVAIIGDSANLASIRLHQRSGFAHTGTLRAVGWKHGRWLDTVLMQRALGPGDAEPSGMAPP